MSDCHLLSLVKSGKVQPRLLHPPQAAWAPRRHRMLFRYGPRPDLIFPFAFILTFCCSEKSPQPPGPCGPRRRCCPALGPSPPLACGRQRNTSSMFPGSGHSLECVAVQETRRAELPGPELPGVHAGSPPVGRARPGETLRASLPAASLGRDQARSSAWEVSGVWVCVGSVGDALGEGPFAPVS